MFNSSTADDKRSDPTLRRIVDFAQDNGFGSLEVLNLFALRSKDPHLIFKCIRCTEIIRASRNRKRKRIHHQPCVQGDDDALVTNDTQCTVDHHLSFNQSLITTEKNNVAMDYNSKEDFISTDDKNTKNVSKCYECTLVDPIGENNDEMIRSRLIGSLETMSVCLAWGALCTKRTQNRAKEVLDLLYDLQSRYGAFPIQCLEYTNLGYPKHPLYIRKGVKMKPYRLLGEEELKIKSKITRKIPVTPIAIAQEGTKEENQIRLDFEGESILPFPSTIY